MQFQCCGSCNFWEKVQNPPPPCRRGGRLADPPPDPPKEGGVLARGGICKAAAGRLHSRCFNQLFCRPIAAFNLNVRQTYFGQNIVHTRHLSKKKFKTGFFAQICRATLQGGLWGAPSRDLCDFRRGGQPAGGSSGGGSRGIQPGEVAGGAAVGFGGGSRVLYPVG